MNRKEVSQIKIRAERSHQTLTGAWPHKSPPENSKNSRTYSNHGLYRLKGTIKQLGGRVIDKRTALGKALSQWRESLIDDLGGKEAISTQQEALVDLCVKSKLVLDSIDVWLLTQPSLINLSRQALIPVVRERTQLADSLARYLGQLGLERKAKTVPPLDEYLAARYATPEKDGDGAKVEEKKNTCT